MATEKESLTIAYLQHLKAMKEAYKKGIPIELLSTKSKVWEPLKDPAWNAHPSLYRIKPDSVVKYTTIYIGE